MAGRWSGDSVYSCNVAAVQKVVSRFRGSEVIPAKSLILAAGIYWENSDQGFI